MTSDIRRKTGTTWKTLTLEESEAVQWRMWLLGTLAIREYLIEQKVEESC